MRLRPATLVLAATLLLSACGGDSGRGPGSAADATATADAAQQAPPSPKLSRDDQADQAAVEACDSVKSLLTSKNLNPSYEAAFNRAHESALRAEKLSDRWAELSEALGLLGAYAQTAISSFEDARAAPNDEIKQAVAQELNDRYASGLLDAKFACDKAYA